MILDSIPFAVHFPSFHNLKLICVIRLSLKQCIFCPYSLLKRASSAKELNHPKAGPDVKEKRPGTGNCIELQ